MNDLAARLDNLERRNCKLTGLLALLALVVVALVAVGWKSPDGTAEATKFVLRDKDGKERAGMCVDEDGTSILYLSDKNQKQRLTLTVDRDGCPSLQLLAPDGAHADMSLFEDRSVGLRLSDPDGKTRIDIDVDASGSPSITVSDKNEKPCAVLGLAVDGGATIDFRDPKGKSRVVMGTAKDGAPSLGLSDASGTKRVFLVAPSDGTTNFQFHDASGKVRGGMSLDKDGSPRLELFDKDGKATWSSLHAAAPPPTGGPVIATRFSPKGGCTAAIVDLIGKAKKSVHVMAYYFTSREIALALIDAHKHGVEVQVVLDGNKGPMDAKGFQGDALVADGVSVWLDVNEEVVHQKVIIVDAEIVEEGSFNFTTAAEEEHSENMNIIEHAPGVCKQFEANFQLHRGHSTQWK